MTSDDKEICPLCMEPMEADDLTFFPCECRYQICRFCWAKIINEENGLCPACRKLYNAEKPASYKPVQDYEPNRKRKDYTKKTKLNPELLRSLPELRVVQPNLIFVVGLPTWITKDKDALKGQDYFGRYGKIFKVEINQNQTFGGPQGQPSFSAYITFYRAEDAIRSIIDLNQRTIHGRSIRVSLGTTKYCSQFLRGSKCTKHECMYLHELGDAAASFTKEEMQAGKHTEYMNKLLDKYSQSSSGLDLVSSNISFTESNEGITETSKIECYSRLNGQQSCKTQNRNECNNEPFSDNPNNNRTHRKLNSHTNQNAVRNLSTQPEARHKHPDDSSSTTDEKSRMNKSNGRWNHVNSSVADYSNTMHIKNSLKQIQSINLENNELQVTNSNCNMLIHYSENKNVIEDNACWSKQNLNVNSSKKVLHIRDDPVDIDFDPFRESQQGLAELLAAEVAQLDISNLPSKHLESLHCMSESNYAPNMSLKTDCLVIMDHKSQECRNQTNSNVNNNRSNTSSNTIINSSGTNNNNADSFSTIHPPPGFEKTTRDHQSYCDSIPNLNIYNPDHGLSGNFNSVSSAQPYPSGFPFLSNKSELDLLNFEAWRQERLMKSNSNDSSIGNISKSTQSFSSNNAHVPEMAASNMPPNQLANLFAAAFNTASVMLNNSNAPCGMNDKSIPTKQPFDFSLFFNQLCRHSSLFSCNTMHPQTDWQAHPPNPTDVYYNKPNVVLNNHKDVLESSKFSINENMENCHPQDRHSAAFDVNSDPFTCRLFNENSFCSKPTNENDPAKWQLDDSAIVSGYTSSAEIWRQTPLFLDKQLNVHAESDIMQTDYNMRGTHQQHSDSVHKSPPLSHLHI